MTLNDGRGESFACLRDTAVKRVEREKVKQVGTNTAQLTQPKKNKAASVRHMKRVVDGGASFFLSCEGLGRMFDHL